jgi:hypothetical protein
MFDVLKAVSDALAKTARWPAGSAGGKGGQFQGGKGDAVVTTSGDRGTVTRMASMSSSKIGVKTHAGASLSVGRDKLLDPRSREAARALIGAARSKMRTARMMGDKEGLARAHMEGRMVVAEARSNRAEARSAFHESRGYKLSNAAHAYKVNGDQARADRLSRLADRSMRTSERHGAKADEWKYKAEIRGEKLRSMGRKPRSGSLTQRQRASINVDPAIRGSSTVRANVPRTAAQMGQGKDWNIGNKGSHGERMSRATRVSSPERMAAARALNDKVGQRLDGLRAKLSNTTASAERKQLIRAIRSNQKAAGKLWDIMHKSMSPSDVHTDGPVGFVDATSARVDQRRSGDPRRLQEVGKWIFSK